MIFVRRALLVLAALVAVALIVPLFVPVGEVEDARPVRELAGEDARYLDFRGVGVHYEQAGSGAPPLVLLHGFGASTFSWREVFAPWSRDRAVLAYDRPAFGLTERPEVTDDLDPYRLDFNLDLLGAMIRHAGDGPAVLVGNSAGGTLALEYALRHPDDVAGLVLISPAVYTSGPPALVRLLWRTPQMERLGPRLLRWALPRFGQRGIDTAWHDPSRVTPAVRAGYALPLRAAGWDRALFAFSRAQKVEPLAPRLADLRVPVLVVTGDDDRIVPTAETVRLGAELGAPAVVIPACGHLAHEECPDVLSAELAKFLATVGDPG